MALSPIRPRRRMLLIMWPMVMLALLPLALFGLGAQKSRTTSILGIVKTENHEPVQGAELIAQSATGEKFRTVSDEGGHFRFDEIPEKNYNIKVFIGGKEVASREVYMSIVGASLAIQIIIPRAVPVTGVIHGTVKDTSGAVIAGADIFFLKSGDHYLIKTDGKGMYKQEGLPPGTWEMTVAATTYRPEKRSVKLAPREESVQDFSLQRAK